MVVSGLTTLLATLIGVFLAFRLNRARERHQSRVGYVRQVAACLYDLANLHATCRRTHEQIRPGATAILEIDAPGLRALLASPSLHEHGGHGLVVALSTLSGLIGGMRNLFDQYRAAAVLGRDLSEEGVVNTRTRLEQLQRAIEYAQHLLDTELARLGLGALRTTEDREIVDRFGRVLRGEPPEEPPMPFEGRYQYPTGIVCLGATVAAGGVSAGLWGWQGLPLTKALNLFLALEGTVLVASAFTPRGLLPPPDGVLARGRWFFDRRSRNVRVSVAFDQIVFYVGLLCLFTAATLAALR